MNPKNTEKENIKAFFNKEIPNNVNNNISTIKESSTDKKTTKNNLETSKFSVNENSHVTICNDDLNLRDLDIQINQLYSKNRDSNEEFETLLMLLGFKNFDELKDAIQKNVNPQILNDFKPIEQRLTELEQGNDALIKKMSK